MIALFNKNFFVIAAVLGFACPGFSQFVRTIGAGALQLDNRANPIKTVTIASPTALAATYVLQLPLTPPPAASSVLESDATGQLSWASSRLPPLPAGNIWVGDATNTAVPYAPTVPGAIFVLSPGNTPAWSTVIPSSTTISISQLTSGTTQPGVIINVGPSSTIQPAGGTIIANGLNGAGPGKYSGAVAIPLNAVNMNVTFTGIQAGAAIVLNICDPGVPGVAPFLENITPGAGFKVDFSAAYPTTTGILNYVVTNP